MVAESGAKQIGTSTQKKIVEERAATQTVAALACHPTLSALQTCSSLSAT